jgi:hypothetical protein
MQESLQGENEIAQPWLEQAKSALSTVKRQDITEFRAMAKPPQLVDKIMAAVSLMLGEDGSWQSVKKLMGPPDFLDRLVNYDVANLSPGIEQKLEEFVKNPDLTEDNLSCMSTFAACVCAWWRCMLEFSAVSNVPNRKKVTLAQAQLEATLKEIDPQGSVEDATLAVRTSLQPTTAEQIQEVRGLATLPPSLATTFAAVAVLLGLPDAGSDPMSAVLAHPDLLEAMRSLNLSSITEDRHKQLQVYIDMPAFTPENVGQTSSLGMQFCTWCRAVDAYVRVAKALARTDQQKREHTATVRDHMAKLKEMVDAVPRQVSLTGPCLHNTRSVRVCVCV